MFLPLIYKKTPLSLTKKICYYDKKTDDVLKVFGYAVQPQ